MDISENDLYDDDFVYEKPYYSLHDVKVEDDSHVLVTFRDGVKKLVNIRKLVGDSPRFADAMKNFSDLKFNSGFIYWGDENTNTDLWGDSLWEAGVSISAL